MENLFVLLVGLLSGSYIFRRIHRMGTAHKRKAPACSSCASGSCGSSTAAATAGSHASQSSGKGDASVDKGETSLPMR